MKIFDYFMMGLFSQVVILGLYFICHHDIFIHFGLIGLSLLIYSIPLVLDLKEKIKLIN